MSKQTAMASRGQVGIDRLPMKKTTHGERESMNCKSCRRRKIKCDRLKPSCEACNIFQCPCVYDAVPKKRGPKTDANVLEALLKRFDGLEKKLQNGKDLSTLLTPGAPNQELPPTNTIFAEEGNTVNEGRSPQFPSLDHQCSPGPRQLPDEIVETFFAKIHGKPYYILDEASFRQNNQLEQLAPSQALAVYATTIRYAPSSFDQGTTKTITEQYALQARALVDIDEPSIESLQTLLLLSMAFYAVGKGNKAYMTLSNGIGMAYALNLHREAPAQSTLHPAEREIRRRLFWACYIMDRFNSCGSKRPSIITDKAILLKLPAFTPHTAAFPIEGKAFNDGPNLQFTHDSVREEQGAITLLIDISRILGMTNRYLAGGGVAGDHHFPWHSGSTLSKIRNELSIWAASTQNSFASVESLFGHHDSTTLFLSKLIYHLTHVLIYRNFLPINLNELRGTGGQHQSWQIEATNQCFLHANLMAELIELGRRDPTMEWPAFVGYCVLTAATVHVHGHHYNGHAGEIYAASGQYLQKEYGQLQWLGTMWTGVQHQKSSLETIVAYHARLVNAHSTEQIAFSPAYLEDFFDRYPEFTFEGAHVSFSDGLDSQQSPSHYVMQDVDKGFPQLTRQISYGHEQAGMIEQSRSNMRRPSMVQRRPSQLSNIRTSQNADGGEQQPHTLLGPREQPSFTPVLPQEPTSSSAGLPNSVRRESTNRSASAASPFSFLTSLSFATKGGTNDPTEGASPFVFPFSPVPLEETSMHTGATSIQSPNTSKNMFQSLEGHTHDIPPGDTQSQHVPTPASEGDPFLKLLEELAQNEQNQGGPSELDFFLNPAISETGSSAPD